MIAGKYRMGRRIGVGGMGVVYEATSVATGRSVAVKVLTSGMPADEDSSVLDLSDSLRAHYDEVAMRFEREARASGAISSENVVQVFDAGADPDSGRSYMVMELLRGSNLRRLAKKTGALLPDTALRIMAQACNGLAAAHEAGVVHRDVKPSNLFLSGSPDGIRVKVLDFGIAKIAFDIAQDAPHTQTGSVMGSPHYMSPEQAAGEKTIDHRTDIWSAGVALFWLLSGKHPYEGDNMGQLLLRICTEEPRPVQDVAPWVAPEIAKVVHRALRPDPEERFSTMREMIAEIGALLPDGRELRAPQLRAIGEYEQQRHAPRLLASEITPPSGRTLKGVSSNDAAAAEAVAEDGPTRIGFRANARGRAKTGWRTLAVVVLVAMGAGVGLSVLRQQHVTPAGAGAAPEVRDLSARLAIEPSTADVLVAGVSVSVDEGGITLRGSAGSVHQVELRTGNTKKMFEVVVTDQGAKPDRVALSSPEPVTSATAIPGLSPRVSASSVSAGSTKRPAPIGWLPAARRLSAKRASGKNAAPDAASTTPPSEPAAKRLGGTDSFE